ncbi:hypothetical protein [Neptuniibacter sp. QD37_11]|uniref:hypothetical protein n=1 Tax=Neptuniibacter sp. QD37_11 TaxID=3398209 RepID=UPI0039F56E28
MSEFQQWFKSLQLERKKELLHDPLALAEAAFKAGQQKTRDNVGKLGNEFDRMHKQVASRYVAERLFSIALPETAEMRKIKLWAEEDLKKQINEANEKALLKVIEDRRQENTV